MSERNDIEQEALDWFEANWDPARPLGGLFCGNTPDVAPGQTLQRESIKKEGFPSPSPVRRSFPLF